MNFDISENSSRQAIHYDIHGSPECHYTVAMKIGSVNVSKYRKLLFYLSLYEEKNYDNTILLNFTGLLIHVIDEFDH